MSPSAVAALPRRLKGASSRAIHLRGLEDFAWQEGYGAFSVSQGDVEAVASYIANQAGPTARVLQRISGN